MMQATTHRVAGMLSTAIIALAAAAPGYAAMVTYEASGIISQADNAAQLPSAFLTAAPGGTLALDFTIDTKSPGVVNAPGDTSYAYALVSANASIGSGTVALGTDLNQVEIFNNSYDGSLYTSGYELLSFANPAADFTGTTSSFALLTQATSATPQKLYKNASLSNAPLSASKATSADGLLLQFTSYLNGIVQSTSDLFVGTDVAIVKAGSGHFAAPEMDPASTASALTLLAGGLIVLSRRRPKAI